MLFHISGLATQSNPPDCRPQVGSFAVEALAGDAFIGALNWSGTPNGLHPQLLTNNEKVISRTQPAARHTSDPQNLSDFCPIVAFLQQSISKNVEEL